jgi:hypothetical protein
MRAKDGPSDCRASSGPLPVAGRERIAAVGLILAAGRLVGLTEGGGTASPERGGTGAKLDRTVCVPFVKMSS